MSGGASDGNQFDQLVNQNLLLSSITPKKMTDFCLGINMKARNYQGNMIGVNLEHQHMARMRNELYCEVIQKKVELEDQMLQQVLENEIPEFSTDAFYSHVWVLKLVTNIFRLQHISSPTYFVSIIRHQHRCNRKITHFLSAGRAQCNLNSLFGRLGDRMVCCGTIVLKRRQGLTDDQVEQCDGILVDLLPKVAFQIDTLNSLSYWLFDSKSESFWKPF